MTEQERLVRLKCDLLVDGVQVPDATKAAMARAGLKMPERVRSGSSEGLELFVGDVAVLAAVRAPDHAGPLYELIESDDEFLVARGDDRWAVDVCRTPAYYSSESTRGVPMSRLAHTCFDRVGVVALRECHFWADPATRCGFCSYGANLGQESSERSPSDLFEAVRAARDDARQPSRHVLISGGSDFDVDGVVVSEVLAVASTLAPLGMPLDAMLSPPSERASFERLRDAGVSTVSINLEINDPETARRIVPGKWRFGRSRYLQALRDAVDVFGRGNVRSLIVVGLESREQTLEGVRAIAETGALPTLSPFRPLRGSDLVNEPAPSAAFLEEIYWEARGIAVETGSALGPACLSCQCNTLAFPWDSQEAD